MTPGGAVGRRGKGKGKGNALLSDYVLTGGARSNMRGAITLGGSLSESPAFNAAASGQSLDEKSLDAEVETLLFRLTAQQATNRWLAEANDTLIANIEAMRLEDIESDARAAKSRRKTKSKTKVKIDPKGGESSSSPPEPVGQATERRDRARKLRKNLRKIRKETKLARSTSSVENADLLSSVPTPCRQREDCVFSARCYLPLDITAILADQCPRYFSADPRHKIVSPQVAALPRLPG